MKKFASLLLVCASVASLSGCSDDTTPATDAGTVTDTGTATDTGGATDGGASACYREEAMGPLCPTMRHQNSMTAPGYRLTFIKIARPAALASQVLLQIVNGTFQGGTFLWGLSLDLTAGTYRTGALNPSALQRGTIGRGLLDGRYAFYNDNAPAAMGMAGRYNPVSGMATLTSDRATTAMSNTIVNIPIFSDETATSVLTTLPLTNLRLSNIQITADRGCIGQASLVSGRFDECRSPWRTEDEAMMPYGQIDADITVADARNVRIEPLQTTLCNYITGVDCTMVTDLSTRPEGQRPDAMVNGMPAFHLTASFSAVSANIPAN